MIPPILRMPIGSLSAAVEQRQVPTAGGCVAPTSPRLLA